MSEIVYDQNGDPIDWDTIGLDPDANYSDDTIDLTQYETYNEANDGSWSYQEPETGLTPSTTPSRSQIRNLRYPLAPTNNHFVRFYINLDEESSIIRKDGVAVIGDAQNSDQNRGNTNTPNESAIKAGVVAVASLAAAQGAMHLFTSGSKYRGLVGTGAAVAAGTAALVSEVPSEVLKLTKKLKRLAASITMYTPPGVNSRYSMSYEMEDNLVAHLANSGMVDGLSEAIGRSISGDGPGLGSAITRILANTNSTVSMLSRTAVNPKKDVLFKKVDNRSFQFTFQMAPRDADEAREVADIIYMFKLFAHPEQIDGYGQFLYLYPAEFDIEYGFVDEKGKQHENPNMNKISSCVLRTINVDYAPNGSFQTLRNGEPVMVNLSLDFMEIELLHQARIKQGY